jgi:hypothetical protein
MSSISKSTTHPPNVPSRLSENVTSDKFIMPVRIPQNNSGETRARRSSSITSGGSLGKRTEMGIMQTDNVIIRDYSSYSDELGVGMHRVDSNSSLSSQNKLNYNQHSRQQYNETNSESNRKSKTEGINIPKSKLTDFNDVLINEGITGSPASGNSLRTQEEELLFNLTLSDEPIGGGGMSDGTVNSSLQVSFPVKASVDGVNNNVKYEAINNTLGTNTENNRVEDAQKMSRIDEELP